MNATVGLIETRLKLREKRDERNRQRASLEQVDHSIREVGNWLIGYESYSEQQLEARRLTKAIGDRRAEKVKLLTKATEIKHSIEKLDTEIDHLKNRQFSSEETLGVALTEYRAVQVEINNLIAENDELLEKSAEAKVGLARAKTRLASAQSAKAVGLSFSDVSDASKSVEAAEQGLHEVEVLLNNLESAIGQMPHRIRTAITILEKEEAEMWWANCELRIAELRKHESFQELKTELEDTFTAWVSAGKTWNFGMFLNIMFMGEAGKSPDRETIAARKREIAQELGITPATK